MNWIESFWKEKLSEIAFKAQFEINRVFWVARKDLQVSRKNDNSIVTELDIFVSNIVKEALRSTSQDQVCFFCEEDKSKLTFPALVVDPIDGTSQIANGESDCCLALAFMDSSRIDDPKNRGWIFNPFTGFEVSTTQKFINPKNINESPLMGLISKIDYKKGYFDDYEFPKNVHLIPKGSIALKLAFLAVGFCDFVFSRTDKHIWDIAAGSILLYQRGYKTYTRDGEITELNIEIMKGPILWCREENFDSLRELLR